jgi:predicted dehydrogenase
MAKLRLGVIGAGSWTVSSHLPNLAAHAGDIEFTVVNRRNPELLARTRAQFGFLKATTEWQAVIDERPDIVVIGTPPVYHFTQAKAALEAGAHVLCEKPFTLAARDAWELARTAERVGRELIVAYGWNYRPMVIEAHRLLHEDGGIGDLEHVSIYMESSLREMLSGIALFGYSDPGYVPQLETWAEPEKSGGGYGQAQLTHALGVALWLTDLRGRAVFALMSSPVPAKVELHDAIALRFANGAIGTIAGASGHVGAAGGRHAVDIRAVGSRGQLHLDLRDGILRRYRGPDDDIAVPLAPDAGAYDCRGPVEALVDAGLGRHFANNSPAELGARTVEILEAAYRSALSGSIEPVTTLD